MIISVRLDESDMMRLNDIREYMDKKWQEIFIDDDPTTNSEAIRACIRVTYDNLIKSNKSDT